MSAFFYLLRHKWFPEKDPRTTFAGKNVMITGANVGLGLEAAVKFTALNADRIIITARSQEKGDRARATIEERTGRQKCVEVWLLDMNSYDSIKAFAERINALDHLDVAVLNAGVQKKKYEESPYGWEETLQVNVLSTVLLGLMLLPKLQESRTKGSIPVLEFVSSGRHEAEKITDEHKDAANVFRSYNNHGLSSFAQYGMSKLLLMFAIKSMAGMVRSGAGADPDVVVTSVCPGLCKSELGRDFINNVFMVVLKNVLFSIFYRTAEAGARTYVSGTLQGPKVHGGFWQYDELKPDAEALRGQEGEHLRQRIWSEIKDALRKDNPDIPLLTEVSKNNIEPLDLDWKTGSEKDSLTTPLSA